MKETTMKFNTCLLFVLVGVTLIHAGPARKAIEKKSLAEDTKIETTKEDLKIEENDEEKGRTKKAAFCLQIDPTSPQIALSDNLVQNIPLTVQAQSVPQPFQALNFIQPAPQNLPQTEVPQTVPKPEPTPSPEIEVETVTEKSKPMRIEKYPQPLPVPQETFTVVPYVPTYQEQLMFISEPEHATYVQVPYTHLHGPLTECTCQNIEPMAMNMMPMPIMPYTSTFQHRSSLMMPHIHGSDVKTAPQGKTRTVINMVPPYGYDHHLHGALNFRGIHHMHPETSLARKHNLLGSPVASETHDLLQINKTPREADSSHLSPEKEAETKQEEGKAMLIDGRRNARSSKEDTKKQEKQIIRT
ncbi:titin-like isoform X2 [Bombus bifarius]|uniref:Titin-like isoform X2 n=1 Tax=Bombus bifarius TaxID=103933 RepID=A0A6P8N609_9HYME|nr:titin-like isoform X2 [Bombus vancouverensis nearcticus]XP_033316313.1 titin-like isoform X2 [Bombus bifarius]